MASLVRIRTIFTGVAGTPWYSNMHFTGVAGDTDSYGEAVEGFWTALSTIMTDEVEWEVQADSSIIESTTGETVGAGVWDGASGAGSNATEALPFSNQGLVNWSTGVFIGGRQLRGKTFVPGLTQTANADGSLGPTTVTAIQAAADGLIGDSNGGLAVFSPTRLTDANVVTAQTSTVIAVLRSRRD